MPRSARPSAYLLLPYLALRLMNAGRYAILQARLYASFPGRSGAAVAAACGPDCAPGGPAVAAITPEAHPLMSARCTLQRFSCKMAAILWNRKTKLIRYRADSSVPPYPIAWFKGNA